MLERSGLRATNSRSSVSRARISTLKGRGGHVYLNFAARCLINIVATSSCYRNVSVRRARQTFNVAGEWVHEVSIPRRCLNPSLSFCPVWLRLRLLFSVMALSLEGPQQRGQSVNGQYVYWICMVYPSAETVQNHGVKTPDDFDRESFRVVLLGSSAPVKSAFCASRRAWTTCPRHACTLLGTVALQRPTFTGRMQ